MRKRGTKTHSIKVDKTLYDRVDALPQPRMGNGEFYDAAVKKELDLIEKKK